MVDKKDTVRYKNKGSKVQIRYPGRSMLAVLGLAGLITGCNTVVAQISKANLQQPDPPAVPLPANTA